MNLLITGGAGYIGGSVATILLQQGHQVTVLDNLCHAKAHELPAGARFAQLDIADRPAVESLLRELKPDGVLHFAALIEAGDSMRVPEVYFRNNTASTLSLLEALHATGTQNLVFSSTAAVYGEPLTTPIEETAALAPTNAYGESKLMVEQMLAWFNRIHGLRYAALRYFNVAGALPGRGEAHEPETHIIPLILDVALGRREKIFIFGDDYPTPDGTCIRDYIHVADLAHAHILALNYLHDLGVPNARPATDLGAPVGVPDGRSLPGGVTRLASETWVAAPRPSTLGAPGLASETWVAAPRPSTLGAPVGVPDGRSLPGGVTRLASETWVGAPQPPSGAPIRLICNLGNGSGFSVKQVIEAARRVTGHPIPVELKPRRPGDPARLVASSALAQQALGWQPAHPTLDDILASAWAWHQQRYKS
jgi:UDP-glucose 4-epimerase